MTTLRATMGTALRNALRDPVWWLLVVIAPLVWVALILYGSGIAPGRPALPALLYGIALYPLLEEYIFRGLLQDGLRRHEAMRAHFGPISLANVITSALFAASHMISQSPLQAASIFLPSLAFGYVFERYRHIAPAILLHAFYNAGFLYLFVR